MWVVNFCWYVITVVTIRNNAGVIKFSTIFKIISKELTYFFIVDSCREIEKFEFNENTSLTRTYFIFMKVNTLYPFSISILIFQHFLLVTNLK